jgi:hypothetical protein
MTPGPAGAAAAAGGGSAAGVAAATGAGGAAGAGALSFWQAPVVTDAATAKTATARLIMAVVLTGAWGSVKHGLRLWWSALRERPAASGLPEFQNGGTTQFSLRDHK